MLINMGIIHKKGICCNPLSSTQDTRELKKAKYIAKDGNACGMKTYKNGKLIFSQKSQATHNNKKSKQNVYCKISNHVTGLLVGPY
jgi:hypothetical protein